MSINHSNTKAVDLYVLIFGHCQSANSTMLARSELMEILAINISEQLKDEEEFTLRSQE